MAGGSDPPLSIPCLGCSGLISLTSDPYHQKFFASEEEYEEYLLNQPLTARFDPDTIEQLVVEGFEKHEAYEMTFDEYKKARARFSEYDPSEKKQLTFYFQSFPSNVMMGMALATETPTYQFMTLMIEMGLIHFQVDYHHEYIELRDNVKTIYRIMSGNNRRHFDQLERHIILLGSGSNARAGKAKKFSPSLPKWLYNAVTDTAGYLNISNSDLVFLCWCVAIRDCLTDEQVNDYVRGEFSHIVHEFEFEFGLHQKHVSAILNDMRGETK